MTASERRLIPSPDLPRDTIERELRARGFRLVKEAPRAHWAYRTFGWAHDGGAQLILVESHIVGVRYAIARGELPAGVEAALRPVARDALLADAARPGAAALPALRALCQLEHEAPSEALLALLTRALRDEDVVVRRLAVNAVLLGLDPRHAGWLVETGRAHERDARMRALYDRIAASQ